MEPPIVVISGCNSGIGKHLAICLAKDGYKVFAGQEHSSPTSGELHTFTQPNITTFSLNLQDSASIKCAADSILQQEKNQIFALINNAGYCQPGAVEDLNPAAIKKQFATNVFGTLEFTQHFLPQFRRQGFGRIIQNTSILTQLNLPFLGAYAASKQALEALSNALYYELKDSGVSLSILQAGPIKTPAFARGYKEFKQQINYQDSHFSNKYFKLGAKLRSCNFMLPGSAEVDAMENKIKYILRCKRPKRIYRVTWLARLMLGLKYLGQEKLLANFLLKT